jgi:hypothetical protein
VPVALPAREGAGAPPPLILGEGRPRAGRNRIRRKKPHRRISVRDVCWAWTCRTRTPTGTRGLPARRRQTERRVPRRGSRQPVRFPGPTHGRLPLPTEFPVRCAVGGLRGAGPPPPPPPRVPPRDRPGKGVPGDRGSAVASPAGVRARRTFRIYGMGLPARVPARFPARWSFRNCTGRRPPTTSKTSAGGQGHGNDRSPWSIPDRIPRSISPRRPSPIPRKSSPVPPEDWLLPPESSLPRRGSSRPRTRSFPVAAIGWGEAGRGGRAVPVRKALPLYGAGRSTERGNLPSRKNRLPHRSWTSPMGRTAPDSDVCSARDLRLPKWFPIPPVPRAPGGEVRRSSPDVGPPHLRAREDDVPPNGVRSGCRADHPGPGAPQGPGTPRATGSVPPPGAERIPQSRRARSRPPAERPPDR